ncbi:glycosyl transferase family 2 [Lactiplantibacillus plantarum]|uniref:glycosyltransferase n=1 Tax=Lactiplantibacillus plantarum TaxID=1590 RepID=UPI0007C2D2D5|nr:glycosyltransferase [Lactiplantibacillus plantarum]ANM73010.1 glycosyl transferase family 2 [Lactiplantibacillus plantarum]ARW35029.1 Putative glycosyltransferase EpsE [Lactiplantibacillus plantarum]KZU10728.1 glycosyltransferase [Lactiplantibacillus plantarum]MCG0668435.1 glycosyl transferase family 2 [Lactiplantibacillus plantarum]WNJ68411.1 glycosyltransferase [Lactiplantibacillus plantarum]
MEISVIMSVYNEQSEQVSQSIDSILGQTCLPAEFVIVLDNPKRNDLKNLLMAYSTQIDIIKVVFNKENIGLAASLNKAIKLSSSELIARMDADDISESRRLELELNELERRRLDLISGNIVYIDEGGNVIGEKSMIPEDERLIEKILPYGSTIIHPTVLMRKAAFNQVGGYRLLTTAEDYDLWLRMIASGLKIGSINNRVLKYRLRDNSMTSNAWKTYIVTKYIQRLYAQRKRTGKDAFKQDDPQLLAKLNDETARQKFNQGQRHFTNMMLNLKERKIWCAFYQLSQAMFTTRDNFCYIANYLRLRMVWVVNGRRYHHV